MNITNTMKLHIIPSPNVQNIIFFKTITNQYANVCNYISNYIFENNLNIKYLQLQKELYKILRSKFGLKSQFALSAIKTVIARYKTVQEQLKQKPYKYKDETEKWVKYYENEGYKVKKSTHKI